MAKHLAIETRGEVAVVRLDRPPANALDLELLEESHGVLDELVASEPAAAVITGCDEFFSAGADLKVVPELDPKDQREMVRALNRVLAGWYAFPRPLVGAINGHAIAGGLILALCCDYRVGSTSGKFGLTELRVGIPYPAVAMAVVKAELSPPVARVLALRAELFESQQALDYGLFDELAPPETVLPRALEVAEEMAALPSVGYERIKRQLRGDTIGEAAAVVAGGTDPLIESWLAAETPAAAAAALRGDE